MLQTKKIATLEKITSEEIFSPDIKCLKNEREMKQAKITQVGLSNPDKIELDH